MSNLIGAAIGGHGEDDNSKSAKELLRELALLNHNDEAISIDWLAQMLGDGRECIRRDGLQQKRQQPISNWTAEDIKSWADELKQQRQARELPELLAVACRACILSNGYYPRDAQLLSILLVSWTFAANCPWRNCGVVVKALRDGVKIDVVTRLWMHWQDATRTVSRDVLRHVRTNSGPFHRSRLSPRAATNSFA